MCPRLDLIIIKILGLTPRLGLSLTCSLPAVKSITFVIKVYDMFN